MIDPVKVLDHWVNGRTNGSLIDPQDPTFITNKIKFYTQPKLTHVTQVGPVGHQFNCKFDQLTGYTKFNGWSIR